MVVVFLTGTFDFIYMFTIVYRVHKMDNRSFLALELSHKPSATFYFCLTARQRAKHTTVFNNAMICDMVIRICDKSNGISLLFLLSTCSQILLFANHVLVNIAVI